MSYFSRDNCQLYYQQWGQGAPLILLHGLGSSTEDWEYQIPALASHYHVICLDVRGHGRSDKPREKYSIKAFAADCLALLDHLNLPQAHVVGISMGGMIALQLAVEQPHRLLSLCIVNSAPEVKLKTLRHWIEAGKRWTLVRLVSLERIAKGLGQILFPKPEQALLREKIAERWPQNDKRAYIASLDAIIGWGVTEQLGRITCPILVIAAERDYTPVADKQAYVNKMPTARLLVIEDSRHATPMDQPEHFNRSLLAFLAEVEQAPVTAHKENPAC
jgi:3-oxoadipate enol-lactonase